MDGEVWYNKRKLRRCGMNVIAINGSPRKNGNSAAMLDAAVKGALENGASCERIDLFDLDYKGCVSCFGCKLLGGESFGKCAQRDALTPVLDKILSADVLLLAMPVYFGEAPGAVRNLLERLWFPGQQYAKNYRSAYPRRMKVGLIYTMNAPAEAMFKNMITWHVQNFSMLLGKTEYVTALDTMQFDDYSKYASGMFDGAAKQLRKDTVFPAECQKAYEMAKRLTT